MKYVDLQIKFKLKLKNIGEKYLFNRHFISTRHLGG